jgi:hypothetical protein
MRLDQAAELSAGLDIPLSTTGDSRRIAVPVARKTVGGVRPGVARAELDRQQLPGALGAVIDERAQRMDPVALLERRPGVLLVQLAEVPANLCKVAPESSGLVSWVR